MRSVKLVSAVIAVLALTSLAIASSASAEIHLWVFLPGASGTHFSGKSGKATLQETKEEGGLGTAITCKESKLVEKESELTSPATDATLALAIIEFSGCKAFGVAVQSLGDASGIILVHLEIHSCLIAGGNRRGLLLEPLPVHIDVPATGLLVDVAGKFVAEIKPIGAEPTANWELVVEQKEGKQTIKECEGGSAVNLTANTDNNGVKKAGQEAKEGTITFTVAQSAMN